MLYNVCLGRAGEEAVTRGKTRGSGLKAASITISRSKALKYLSRLKIRYINMQ